MRPQSKNIFPEFFSNEPEAESKNEKHTKNLQQYRELYKTFDDYLTTQTVNASLGFSSRHGHFARGFHGGGTRMVFSFLAMP